MKLNKTEQRMADRLEAGETVKVDNRDSGLRQRYAADTLLESGIARLVSTEKTFDGYAIRTLKIA